MSFTTFTEVLPNSQFQEVKDVLPDQVKKAYFDITIVDVREDDEWNGELGHIENAKLINLSALPQKISEVPQNKPVVFVCRSGGRSARAAAFFKEQGYTDVYNMKGGMILWNQQGFPISRK